MDLDQAFVINGDDLRIALGEIQPKTLVPREVAEHVLTENAQPLGAVKAAFDRARLSRAIEVVSQRVPIENLAPDALAKRLLNAIASDAAWGGSDGEEREPVRLYDVGADPELAAMAALLPALPLVSKLGCDARNRVMEWATRRATDGLAPF